MHWRGQRATQIPTAPRVPQSCLAALQSAGGYTCQSGAVGMDAKCTVVKWSPKDSEVQKYNLTQSESQIQLKAFIVKSKGLERPSFYRCCQCHCINCVFLAVYFGSKALWRFIMSSGIFGSHYTALDIYKVHSGRPSLIMRTWPARH